MKNLKLLTIISSILLTQFIFASDTNEDGHKLYKTNCAVCHGSTGGIDMNKRIAPPIAAVRMHYINTYPDQTSFVKAISNWVEKQEPSKSLMPGAIQKFNIMPPVSISKADAQKIASYIYTGNIEEVEGFKEHVEKEHGKLGQDKKYGMKHGGMGKNTKRMHNKSMHEPKMHNKMKNMSNMQDINKGKRGGMGKMMQQLGITPEQRAQMQPLMRQKQATMKPLRQEMQYIKRQIADLDTASPNYKSNIFSLAEKKAALVHRMTIEKGEMRMKLDSILTPEQRIQLKKLKQKHKSSRENKHGTMNIK